MAKPSIKIVRTKSGKIAGKLMEIPDSGEGHRERVSVPLEAIVHKLKQRTKSSAPWKT